MSSKHKGRLIIISAPSGGGKNTIISTLLKEISGSARYITTTTRPLREGEKNGVDYYFTTVEDFKKKIASGEFLEYNIYAGNYYGTERKYLEKRLSEYKIVFSLIEVNGKHQLEKNNVPHVSVFLLPESLDVLRGRIQRRGSVTDELIKERLEIAKNEIKASKYYDYVIVNKDGHLAETVEEVRKVVKDVLAGTAKQSLTKKSN